MKNLVDSYQGSIDDEDQVHLKQIFIQAVDNKSTPPLSEPVSAITSGQLATIFGWINSADAMGRLFGQPNESDSDDEDVIAILHGERGMQAVLSGLLAPVAAHSDTQLLFDGNRSLPLLTAIELDYDDETLIEKFLELVHEERENMDLLQARKKPKTINFQRWFTHAVLPYFDLTLWAEITSQKLTQSELGHMLWPNNYESDLTEHIRHTTRKHARVVFTYETYVRVQAVVDADAHVPRSEQQRRFDKFLGDAL